MRRSTPPPENCTLALAGIRHRPRSSHVVLRCEVEITRAREQGARMVMLFYDFGCEHELHRHGLTDRLVVPLDGPEAVGMRVISFERTF